MTSAAHDALSAATAEDWPAASAALDELEDAWEAYRPAGLPRLVEPVLDETLQVLRSAIDGEHPEAAAQSAIDAARLALDLQLRHRPPVEVDLARFDLWLAQVELDAAAEDVAPVNGDYFALDYVRDRIMHAIDPADLASVNLALEELLGAIADEDHEAVAEIATGLRETVAGLTLED